MTTVPEELNLERASDRARYNTFIAERAPSEIQRLRDRLAYMKRMLIRSTVLWFLVAVAFFALGYAMGVR